MRCIYHKNTCNTFMVVVGLFDKEMYTSGVGTTIYAAPEQLSGGSYDSKVNLSPSLYSILYIYMGYK